MFKNAEVWDTSACYRNISKLKMWVYCSKLEVLQPGSAGVGLNFDPIEFRPVGSWFNGLCSGFNGFFMLNCDPPRQGVIVLRPLRRIKFGLPLNCNPQVLIPRWIMTPYLDSTLNVDPESWFNIKLWPWIGITIQCGIVTRGHDSTWNCDPGS